MKRIRDFDIIKKSKSFSKLYKNSKKDFSASFVLFYKECEEKKVGFTASKKIGNAVKRNFAKRRMRALFQEFSSDLKQGLYILVARDKILTLDYKNLKQDFLKSLKKAKALSNQSFKKA